MAGPSLAAGDPSPQSDYRLLIHLTARQWPDNGSLRSLKLSTPLCPGAFISWSTFVPPSANLSIRRTSRAFRTHTGRGLLSGTMQRFEAALEGDAWSATGMSERFWPASGFYARKTMRFSHFLQAFPRIHQGTVMSQPIKGTAPRYVDPEQDAALAQALLNSEKDRAENVMITDLLRNDSAICQTGSVNVPSSAACIATTTCTNWSAR